MEQIGCKLRNINTIRATSRDVKQFQDFLQTLMVVDPIEQLSPENLNVYLAKYFEAALKKNGTMYEPDSLMAKLCSINRYLVNANYNCSLHRDPRFQLARDSLKAKQVQSREDGKGHRPHKTSGLSKEDEDKLWKAQVFGADSPFTLQFSIW